MAKINPNMEAQKRHAEREEVWAEVLEWYQRQIATDKHLACFTRLYDSLQLEGADLRRAFMAMGTDELDIVSRLATAALIEAANRSCCAGDGDDGKD